MRFNFYKRTFLPGKQKSIIYLLFIVICCIIFIGCILKKIYPVYIAKIEVYSNNISNTLINKSISNVMEKYSDEKLIDFSTDVNGNITAIQTNTIFINIIKADLSDEIQTQIKEIVPEYIKIPVGSLSDFEFLSGIGPEIKIHVSPGINIKTDFTDEFKSSGINQVKHTVIMNIKSSMTFSSVTMKKTFTYSTAIPVAETIIAGNVPKYYGIQSHSILSDEMELN